MKKTLIGMIATAFAAVSFAAQTPAKPETSNAGQAASTNSTAKSKVVKKHHTVKKSTKPAAGKSETPQK
jgi:hypothetical protein